MNPTENLKSGTLVRWVLIIVAAVIIGGVIAGKLASNLPRPKPAPREQIAAIPQKWQFTAEGPITGALALDDDGTLYAAGKDGFVYALDSSGTLQWKFNAGPMLAGPVIGWDGTIFVSNQGESTYAINRNGSLQWAIEGGPYADSSIAVSLALDRERLYKPWRGQIHAIGLNSRESDWSAGNFQTNGSVAILPDGVIVYPGAGRLDAVDSQGRTVWQYPAMDPPLSADAIIKNGGQVPVGDFWLESGIAVGAYGTLYACAVNQPDSVRQVDPRLVALAPDGTFKWVFRTKTHYANRATPVIATDDTVYFGSGDGVLYALTPEGTQKWAVDTGAPIVANILSQDGTVYVLNRDSLVAVSPEGKLLTKNPIAGILEPPRVQLIAISVEQRKVLTNLPADETVEPSPALASDGTIYVGTHGGKIVAFAGTHGGLMNSPWPKFQGELGNAGRSLLPER